MYGDCVAVPPNPNYVAEVVVLLTSLGVDRKQKKESNQICDLLEIKRVHRKVIDMNKDTHCGNDDGQSEATERLMNRKELESWKLPQVFIDGCFAGDVPQLQNLEDDGVLGRILRRQLCLKCHSPKDSSHMTCPVCGAEFEEVMQKHRPIEEELERLHGKYTDEDRADESSDSGDEAGERFNSYVSAWWQTYGNDDPAWLNAVAEEAVEEAAGGAGQEPTANAVAVEPAAEQQSVEGAAADAARSAPEEAKTSTAEEAEPGGPTSPATGGQTPPATEGVKTMTPQMLGKLKMQQVKDMMQADATNSPKKKLVENPLKGRRRKEKGSAAALLKGKKEELLFGMDREAQEKKANKYDIGLVEEVVEWIEAITGLKQGDASFADWLKSGQVLCAVANAIRPGAIKRVSTSPVPFKQMENITMFMNEARELGVPESAMFGTPDLFEEKDLGAVVNCIYTFGGVVQVQCQEFSGPKLGVPLNVTARTHKREKTAQVTQFSGYAGALEKAEVSKAIPIGMKEGKASEDGVYGIDRELKEKQEAKYDVALEKQVTEWIEAISGEKKGDEETIQEWLKNGRILCVLVNAIRPGTIKKVHSSKLAFKQMENITFFTSVAREVGVPESAMFGTADLFEGKNMGSVMTCIFMFAGAVQVHWPEFPGPHLGVPLHVESKSKRRQVGLVTDMSSGLNTAMEVERPHDPLHIIRSG
uniref:Calponin-homology (CH) domain-containing protein n=1 Tax=Alexandrium monilatum TaxID=311494 RepID=A0A7S4W504_9DINO|mmetsp:Transcript_5644/g.16786  ORF Transcript_5644/g.16786 Transcript_5644/m.16786 type:complete len:702 (+) Transcript_5644:51-2156(+)